MAVTGIQVTRGVLNRLTCQDQVDAYKVPACRGTPLHTLCPFRPKAVGDVTQQMVKYVEMMKQKYLWPEVTNNSSGLTGLFIRYT